MHQFQTSWYESFFWLMERTYETKCTVVCNTFGSKNMEWCVEEISDLQSN